jgi:hypothetical protein
MNSVQEGRQFMNSTHCYNEREYKVAVMDDGSLQIGPLWDEMGYEMTTAAFAARHFEITYEEEDP